LSWDSTVRIVSGFGTDDQDFFFGITLWVGLSVFSKVSIPDQESTQPPIQLVPVAKSSGLKQPWRKADHSHLSCPKVKKELTCTSTLSYELLACTWRTLPLTSRALPLHCYHCSVFRNCCVLIESACKPNIAHYA